MKFGKKELALLISIKIIILITFSSGYLTQLFSPFVEHYLHNIIQNPWNYFFLNNSSVEFPYNPLMLYILSFFFLPIKLLGLTSPYIKNFLLKLPSLLTDLIIFYLLYKSYPNKHKEIFLFYLASPIIFYAVYMHSQLDLIPTMLLFASIYFLKKQKLTTSAIFFGCALGTKFHIAAALPLVIIYLLKNFTLKKTAIFLAITGGIYSILVGPYFFSPGYYHLVLKHPKQMMLFESFATLGTLKIYLPILALLIIYGRFFAYPKINNDLLDAFLAITFSILVLLIPPAPGWYIWMHPFLSALFIKHYVLNKFSILLYSVMASTYCLFFLFLFSSSTLHDILFLNKPLILIIDNPLLKNITFTLLESTLFLAIYFLYKFGIKSNQVYARTQVLTIGISGDSGAGKTTLMTDFKNILGSKATILEGDADHKWERGNKNWKLFTHLNPKANFLHRQAEDIFMLKQGLPIYRTHYNHKTGHFDPPKLIPSTDFILFAGLHPLYLPKMRKLIDLKIFIDPDKKLQFHWKIIRDIHERGHSIEKILQQIKQRKHDKTKHIEPQKHFADVVISYFTNDKFEVGNPNHHPTTHVKITLDSSITLDTFIKHLIKNNISIEWDYSDDLQTQYITIFKELSTEQLSELANKSLINSEEISTNLKHWEPGHRGFVQLVLLIILSEKMKEQRSTWKKNMESYSTWTAPFTTTTQHTVQH